jgi:GNAT superfamily N-acetyltransferase
VTLRIRPATPKDVPALVGLAPTSAQRAQHIAGWVAGGFVVVADDGGTPVGYGVMRDIFFMEPFIELVLVAPSARRRGVGRAIVRHFVAAAGPRVWISTNQSNLPMQALIADEGFTRAGTVDVDEGDPELFYSRTAQSTAPAGISFPQQE